MVRPMDPLQLENIKSDIELVRNTAEKVNKHTGSFYLQGPQLN